ncbi:MAG TPA: cytochrome c oxidase subunit II [Alphaproteobacteria bacterium]|nr:cytochrome c oxidase subunit II [Alphaproteobacteria bacterium]
MKLSQVFAKIAAGVCAAAALLLPALATAAVPQPWTFGFQDAATPVAKDIHDLHHLLLIIITVITLFVLALLVYVIIRFNAKRNPVPSRTAHNTLIEVLWTVIPVMILVVIAVPSFKLLYFMDRTDKPELTLKVIGHQWYWSYQYQDNGDFTFDSLIVPQDQLKPGQHRLLEVDNQVVLPVNTNIRVLVTSEDVLHAWAVPAFGVKIDTVPGHLNETWMRIERPGTYYGQCSELCGVNHGFMPIAVKAVSKEEFQAWVEEAKKKFADAGASAPVFAESSSPAPAANATQLAAIAQ